MAFADLAKAHASFITNHVFGESVEYRVHPEPVWRAAFLAQVQRMPVDPIGQTLSNTAEVFVSKALVPEVSVGKDSIRFLADAKEGAPAPTWRVTEVLNEGPGHWWLRCMR